MSAYLIAAACVVVAVTFALAATTLRRTSTGSALVLASLAGGFSLTGGAWMVAIARTVLV